MNPKELAEHLGVPVRTVYSFAEQGLLPVHRIGVRLIRISAEDLEEFYRRSREATGEAQ